MGDEMKKLSIKTNRIIRACGFCPMLSDVHSYDYYFRCHAKSSDGRQIPIHINVDEEMPKWCPLDSVKLKDITWSKKE